MIRARPNRIFETLFFVLIERALRKRFFSLSAALPAATDFTRPTLLLANHTNWWDGFVTYWLARRLTRRRPHLMMGEPELRKHPFFRWAGVFSVPLDDPARAGASLRYALKLLRNDRGILILFPQGRMTAAHETVDVRPGAAWLWRAWPELQVLAVAIRYAWLRESRPQIFLSLQTVTPPAEQSPARKADVAHRSRQIREALNGQLSALDHQLRAGDLGSFRVLLRGPLSINKRWEWFSLAMRGRAREFNPCND
jgi:1-acyl-sn-glycerol-3-phosphate acyltransferase